MKSPFETFDSALIRSAKNRQVILKEVKERVIYLEIDDEVVKVEKTSNGLNVSCSCRWCSIKGIPNNVFNCGRIIRAWMYLIEKNGRIFEMNTEENKKVRMGVAGK